MRIQKWPYRHLVYEYEYAHKCLSSVRRLSPSLLANRCYLYANALFCFAAVQ